jgi:hypothetical protein
MSGYDAARGVVFIIWIVVLLRFGITAWQRRRWSGIALTVAVWLLSGVAAAMTSVMLTGLAGGRWAWDLGGPLVIAAGVAYWRRRIAGSHAKA